MALGVLNNLSAIYAENNLNNTNNSLQTVLQQLSSGSKINSGADDAAGLSLVNGLEANSMALTQSETNATEGVGLLDVADGALSQVTSLLDRAITLATEASNGTLNSSQESAANQEYTSILSEINNIGSTTTYNQQSVFTGSDVAIYTGDSSTTGSSVDNLNIRSLSESSVGDTDGVMSYSNGKGNVFVDLSNAGTLAKASDALSSATTTIDVSYLTQGANGTQVSNSTISVGAGTNNPLDTAQGLINAINSSGLGLTATFTSGTQAGDSVAGTDTGIEISGAGLGVGNGTTPGDVGTVSIGGGGAAGDLLTGTLTIKTADGTTHNITLSAANNNDTLALLKASINAAGYGITASVAGTTLTFTSASSAVSITATGLTDAAGGGKTATYAAGNYYTTGVTDSGGGTTVEDAATAQAGTATYTANAQGTGGTATISYTDASGADAERHGSAHAERRGVGAQRPQPGHQRCRRTGRLHRRADQHAQLCQPGDDHPAGERHLSAKRHPGNRLRLGHFEHVEVRDPEPDRHRGSRPGQQRSAGGHQAAAVVFSGLEKLAVSHDCFNFKKTQGQGGGRQKACRHFFLSGGAVFF
jgi:flagellin